MSSYYQSDYEKKVQQEPRVMLSLSQAQRLSKLLADTDVISDTLRRNYPRDDSFGYMTMSYQTGVMNELFDFTTPLNKQIDQAKTAAAAVKSFEADSLVDYELTVTANRQKMLAAWQQQSQQLLQYMVQDDENIDLDIDLDSEMLKLRQVVIKIRDTLPNIRGIEQGQEQASVIKQ